MKFCISTYLYKEIFIYVQGQTNREGDRKELAFGVIPEFKSCLCDLFTS